jgi:hypothetical protein
MCLSLLVNRFRKGFPLRSHTAYSSLPVYLVLIAECVGLHENPLAERLDLKAVFPSSLYGEKEMEERVVYLYPPS